MSRQVLIVGAGASGLMAGIRAARAGAEVTVLDHNERPGRKLLATGNGKCNLTNLDMHPRHFHGGDQKAIEAILAQMTQAETMEFFFSLGLDLIDRDGWVYPATAQAASVLDLLLLECDRLAVKRKYGEHVTSLTDTGHGFFLRTEGWQYEADAVVVACGSPASEIRGCTGDALALAAENQIRTKPFLPALAPLLASGPFLASWAGTRARGTIALLVDGKEVAAETGEIQFTGHGVSGIPAMQLSHLVSAAGEEKRDMAVLLDLAPSSDEEEVKHRLCAIRAQAPDKTMEQALRGILPSGLIPAICAQHGVSRRSSALTKEERERECTDAARAIKTFSLPLRGAAPCASAQVCSGGILLSELTGQLEGKSHPGLFFAGECVDVHGDCGGYNLQWAWSSGAVAGLAAAGGMT